MIDGSTCAHLSILGVRSLANASRARQFNPLNPPGAGWVPLPQTNNYGSRGRSCAVVRAWFVCVVVCGRAWSCVVVRGRARSCLCGRAWSCAVCRARSVVRGRVRSCVRGRSFVVVRGRAWSCVVVRGRAWSCAVVRGRSYVVLRSCRSARFAASTAMTRTNEGTNERTTSNNPLNPPGVEWVKFFLWAHACQIWERPDGRFENFVFQIYK